MRISDWSSGVCSSDLCVAGLIFLECAPKTILSNPDQIARHRIGGIAIARDDMAAKRVVEDGRSLRRLVAMRLVIAVSIDILLPAREQRDPRSAERRGGNGVVRTCRERWAPCHYKKNQTHKIKTEEN